MHSRLHCILMKQPAGEHRRTYVTMMLANESADRGSLAWFDTVGMHSASQALQFDSGKCGGQSSSKCMNLMFNQHLLLHFWQRNSCRGCQRFTYGVNMSAGLL